MKKIYLSLLSILALIATSVAQPSITAANFNPYDGFTAKYFSFTPFPFDPGPAGANVTWDFSGILANDSTNVTFMAASATAQAASFPSANLATGDAGIGYDFLITDANHLARAGAYITTGNILMYYHDAETILTYPFTINSTFTDTWASNFTAGGYQVFRTAMTTVTADAYGTLILPWGNVSNVLRVHLEETITDSVFGPPATATNDAYIYLTPGVHYFLLSITQSGSNFRGSYIDASGVGINSIADSKYLTIYPSPASRTLNVDFTAEEKIVSTRITDVSGKEIYSNQVNLNPQQRIDIESLASGYYFINIQTAEKTFTKKFIKQ